MRRNHGSKSPRVGRCPTGAPRSPTTSTRMSVPGDSLAIRVALVTPLYNCSSPSEPRYTQGMGIPAVKEPNRAICQCSLMGSAPDRRDGGTGSVRGSTSSQCVPMRSIVTDGGTSERRGKGARGVPRGRLPTPSFPSFLWRQRFLSPDFPMRDIYRLHSHFQRLVLSLILHGSEPDGPL